MVQVELQVNGKQVSHPVEDRTLLVEFLRQTLRLTGTHVGCDTTQCGACTVHLDGVAVKSCTVLAAQASGGTVVTVEGLATEGKLHPVQEAFVQCHGLAVRLLHARHDHGRGDYFSTPIRRSTTTAFIARSKATSAVAPATSTSSRRFATRPAPRPRRTAGTTQGAGMIGKPLPRLEDRALRHGQRQLYRRHQPRRPGLMPPSCGRPTRTPRCAPSTPAAAQAAPGVIAVLTGHDYVDDGFPGHRSHAEPGRRGRAPEARLPDFADRLGIQSRPLPLPIDKVRYVGEAVAMVIAETPLRRRAMRPKLIEVDYEPLDAVVRADDAMRDGAPQLWDGRARQSVLPGPDLGERDAVRRIFAEAPHVVRREFHNSRIVNCQMEPRAAIGAYDPQTERYTLISGSQGVSRQKSHLAAALQAPPDKVRVVCPDTGGGFGPRTFVYVEQLAVVWAARRVGRPVKWTSDRSEAFLSDYQGRDAIIRAAIGVCRTTAASSPSTTNGSAMSARRPCRYVPDVQRHAHHDHRLSRAGVAACCVSGVLTNTVPTAPYRGAGRPEATHVMERMLDLAAGELGIDRVEIRRRNLVGRDKLPYRSPMGLTYDSGDFAGNMERALELADWDGYAQRARRRARGSGRLRGIGAGQLYRSRRWARRANASK